MRQASMDSSAPSGPTPPRANARSWTPQNLRLWTLFSPAVLILTSLAVFQVTKSVTDEWVAQLTGFTFYWITGGIIIPLIILGRQGYASLFARPRVKWSVALGAGVAGLFLPAAFGFLFAFPFLFPAESKLLLPGIALYALVNGTFEEVFWRGLFIRQFRANPWLGIIYPSVAFGIWQLVPWAMFDFWLRPPAALLLAVFVAAGLLYGWVAWRTESIRWTVMAHVLANLSGIGALIIFAPA